MHASNHASILANHPDVLIETTRKTVKQIGKETTFLRLTPEEKEQLQEIDHTYKRRGIRTSENEISRIDLKFLQKIIKHMGKQVFLREYSQRSMHDSKLASMLALCRKLPT